MPVSPIDDLGPEEIGDRLGQGDHVPLLIHDGERGRARVLGLRRIARGDLVADPLGRDPGGPGLGVGLGQQARDGDPDEVRIADEGPPVRRAELHRLGHDVDAPGRIRSVLGQVEVLQDMHDLDDAQPADRRRGGDEVVSPVAAPDGFALDRLVGGQVGLGDEPAARGERGGDPAGESAAVELVRSAVGDPAQGPGEARVPEDPARFERQSFGAEDPGQALVLGQRFEVVDDEAGQRRPDGEAVGGELDRGGQDAGEAERAVFFERRAQPGHGPGDGRRAEPGRGDAFGIARHGRRGRAVVDGDRFPLLGEVDDHHPFAADAVRVGLDDADRERRGYGRVDGVPAGLEHVQSRLRSEGMGGGDHPADGADLGVLHPRLGDRRNDLRGARRQQEEKDEEDADGSFIHGLSLASMSGPI